MDGPFMNQREVRTSQRLAALEAQVERLIAALEAAEIPLPEVDDEEV